MPPTIAVALAFRRGELPAIGIRIPAMSMTWKQLLSSRRPRPSTSPGDHRAEFERDLDRAVFSTPVKRLQDKAQVFPLEPNDAVRTRLTHSMEVSSVARGLATAASKWLLDEGEIDPGMDRQIEAVAATCGLIHDLGNPPFGHAGEDAIQSWFVVRFGHDRLRELLAEPQCAFDFIRFEGNAQTLRLVSKLQILADFNGLNLTFGTLSASCKYIAASHLTGGADHAKAKPGYFASENRLVEQMREETGTGAARNPITFLVEAADDIVYSVADVEDGVRKGIISWRELKRELRQRTKAAGPVAVALLLEAFERQMRILKAGTSSVPAGLPDDVQCSAFRTACISMFVTAVIQAFKDRYEKIKTGKYENELVKDAATAPLIKILKQIGSDRIYSTAATLKLELMGRRIIHDLLDLFWEGAEQLPSSGQPNPKEFKGKLGALLSENYRRVFQHTMSNPSGLPEEYHRFQLVTDYVCGMTDTFARKLHADLTNG